MPAGVPLCVALVQQLCQQRSITHADLQKQSGLHEKTFKRIMTNGSGSADSIGRIAGALGISLQEIKTGVLQDDIPKPKRRFKERYACSLYLDIAYADMLKPNAQRERADLLKRFIHATSPIEPVRVEDGSTILHLSIFDTDILRLLAAMMDNELDVLRITKVVIPNTSWLIIMLALLNYNNRDLVKKWRLTPLSPAAQPQLIQPEALSLLLGNHVLEHDMKMKTRDCFICKGID